MENLIVKHIEQSELDDMKNENGQSPESGTAEVTPQGRSFSRVNHG